MPSGRLDDEDTGCPVSIFCLPELYDIRRPLDAFRQPKPLKTEFSNGVGKDFIIKVK